MFNSDLVPHASRTLHQLYQDIEKTAVSAVPSNQVVVGEALELAEIRRAFNDLTANLVAVSLSNQQFTNVLDSLHEMLLVCDNHHSKLLSNQCLNNFCEKQTLNEDDLGSSLAAQLTDNIPAELRYSGSALAGDTRIKWTALALIDSRSDRAGTIYVGQDITAQRSLESHVKLLSQAIDEATVGIVIADIQHPDQPIIYANQAFENMTGYDRQEMLGKNCRVMQGESTKQNIFRQFAMQ